jgi:hypothetical protein
MSYTLGHKNMTGVCGYGQRLSSHLFSSTHTPTHTHTHTHTTLPHHTPNGIRTHNPIKRPAADQSLKMATCTGTGKWAVSVTMFVFQSDGYVW